MSRPSKIVCVGRNYAAHAKELGNAVPDRPLLFFKPPSSLIGNGDAIVLPTEYSKQVEHEAEVAVVIGALLAVVLLTFLLLLASAQVQKLLGVTGLHVITRVMGVLLAALAVQFLFDGIAASGLLAGSSRP